MERRKPLKRGGPLKRKTRLKSASSPKQRKPLQQKKAIQARPKPKRSAVEQQASEVWRTIVVARGCEVCARRGEVCEGALQAHHVVTQQQLRRRGLAAFTWDVDDGLCVCERAHRRHHNRRQPIERKFLRTETLAFAERHDCSDLIERYYPAE